MSNHRIRSKSEGDSLRAGIISEFVHVVTKHKNKRRYLLSTLIERTLIFHLMPTRFVVIGDEILKGQFQDVNSYYFAQQLWELGIQVCKVTLHHYDVTVYKQL